MIWKCLIADDEPPATRILEKYISMTRELELAGICQNAFEVLTLLKSKEINLMFLDIHMPKLSGLSLMNSLSAPPRVIFTTAYKEYAANAFDMDAIDYLVKPVSFERFLKAVDKLSRYDSSPAKNTFLPDQNGFLYFRSNRKMVKVFLFDILYIESVKDYIKIFRSSEPALMIRQSIALTEAMLPSSDFIRVHRSFIVSIKHITAFTSTDIEIGNIEIPVGRFYGTLRQKGFKGSFPHFRRVTSERINLMTFQFNKYGGGFVIEVTNCQPTGFTNPWGRKIEPNKLTAHDLYKRKRIQANMNTSNSSTEDWFRYDTKNLSGLGNIYKKICNDVLSKLDIAEDYWQNGELSG